MSLAEARKRLESAERLQINHPVGSDYAAAILLQLTRAVREVIEALTPAVSELEERGEPYPIADGDGWADERSLLEREDSWLA